MTPRPILQRVRQVPPTRTILFGLGLACALATASAADDATPSPSADSPWTDQRIEEAIRVGCEGGNPMHHYEGSARDFDVPGPLWLTEPGEDRARGVVMPTYLRLFQYGRHWRCKNLDLDHARKLAGPETWIVLWRVEQPHRGPSEPRSDQTVLRPIEVRHRADGAWHHPVRTRTSDSWMLSWFFEDWNDDESLVAEFAQLSHTGSLRVDYAVEEGGRSNLTDSSIHGLTMLPAKWWALAHGEPPPKGGSWWKR